MTAVTLRATLSLDGGLSEGGLRAKLQLARNGRNCVTRQGSLPCHPILAEQVDRFWQLVTEFPDLRIKPKSIRLQSPRPRHNQRCRLAADRLANTMNQWLHGPEFREIERALLKFGQPNDRLWLSIHTDDPHARLLPWQVWEALSDYRFEWGCAPMDGWHLERPFRRVQPGLVQVLAVLGDRDCLDLSPDREALQQLQRDELAEVTLLDTPSAESFFQRLYQTAPDVLVFSGHGRPGGNRRSGQITIAPGQNLSIEDFSHALDRAVRNGLQVGIFNCCNSIDLAQSLHRLHLPVAIVMRAPVPDLLAQQFIKDFLRLYAQEDSLAIAFREARRGLQSLESKFPGATWLPLIYHHPFTELPNWSGLRLAIAPPTAAPTLTDRNTDGDINGDINGDTDGDTINGDTDGHIPRNTDHDIKRNIPHKIPRNTDHWVDHWVDRVTTPQRDWSVEDVDPLPADLGLTDIESDVSIAPIAPTLIAPTSTRPLPVPENWQRRVIRLLGRSLGRSLGIAAIATAFIAAAGRWIEPIELAIYDFGLQQRPAEPIDDRFLLVTIDQADMDYQVRQGWQRLIWQGTAGSLAPEALTRLLDRLRDIQPSAIGLDIYYPRSSHSPAQWKQWAQQGLFGICKVADPTSETAEIPAPPHLPGDRLTFTDLDADADGVVRRQLLTMPMTKSTGQLGRLCQTEYALSAALADHYLQQQGQVPQHRRATGQWGYGDRLIPQLASGAGGYGPLVAAENQLLLNFRQGTQPWRSISLTQVLVEGIPPQWRPRARPIVLIGRIDRHSNDWWLVPGGRTIPGLELQAHGASQLISTVLDNRPLLQALAWPAKGFWIGAWVGIVVLGGCCLPERSPWRHRLSWVGGAIGLMTIISALSFGWWGWWLPTASPAIAMILALPFTKGRLISRLIKGRSGDRMTGANPN
ncbi:MAG: CHASE2 domain-containing protein [Oscillatoriales cyanobacterium]|nr:MAG: CHASE2 domain-containing protein [Oscillatoriales cyanobacterium]